MAIADGVAHFQNVQTCGSVWSCPICGPKIRQERAVEIDQAMQLWLDLEWGDGTSCSFQTGDSGYLQNGNNPELQFETPDRRVQNATGAVLFLTLTMPHDFGDELRELFNAQKAAWSRIFSGRAWQQDKAAFGVQHYIRAWDCTHGANGWHPHAHAVLFSTRTPSEHELQLLEDRLYERWAEAVEERGYRRPTRRNGIKLELARSREDLARYVAQLAVVTMDDDACKVALEVARTDLKQGRKGHLTPFEILATFTASGDCEQLELWREWERATAGKHAIQWSRGLRAMLAIVARTDEEIAAEEIGGEKLFSFKADEWVAVCHGRRGQRRVLEAAESGGAAAIAGVVSQLLQSFHRKRQRQAQRELHSRATLQNETHQVGA